MIKASNYKHFLIVFLFGIKSEPNVVLHYLICDFEGLDSVKQWMDFA